MSYLPLPGPTPSIDDAPFWQSCHDRALRFQRCAACRRFRHPPGPGCPACTSLASTWEPASDDARLFSFTVVRHAVSQALVAHVPYNVAVVEFPAIGGVRLISNVTDVPPAELRIGLPLVLDWQVAPNGVPLPRFRRRF
jgi:uncharacterized OB-fold protein